MSFFRQSKRGDITIEDALKKAGYSDTTARQQKRAVDGVRHNTVMQQALRKAGVTEDRIAQKIGKGMNYYIPQVGRGSTKLAAELIDAFPSKKIEITEPLSYGDVEDDHGNKSEKPRRGPQVGGIEWR